VNFANAYHEQVLIDPPLAVLAEDDNTYPRNLAATASQFTTFHHAVM